MDTIKISVENFGPLAKAEINLKPLTIFVGSNNSGKSYIAQLVYAISRISSEMMELDDRPNISLMQRIRSWQYGLTSGSRIRGREYENAIDGRTLNAFRRLLPDNWFDLMAKGGTIRSRRINIPFDSLPLRIQVFIERYLMEILSMFENVLSRELERCYDSKLSGLACKLTDNTSFSVSIESKKPVLKLAFNSKANSLRTTSKVLSLRGEMIHFVLPRLFIGRPTDGESDEDNQRRYLRNAFNRAVVSSFSNIISILPKKSFYLPAARSGILHGQKAIARVGFRTMQRAGIESISIPKFPGVVIDFLDSIYSIDKDEHGDFSQIAKELEKKLTPGRIEFVEGKQEAPEIYFREPKVGRIGLHRTSSMISELAPIILLLRYLVDKGQTVIIEEPESHMHPEAQREIAKILVKLVNSGAKVLLTTHSDYLLQQISNLVALSEKSHNQKQKLGYTEEDLIPPSEVGVYLFGRSSYKDGTIVKELQVGENGILEEEYGNIAAALYNETVEAKGN